eukprot:TRINITY_DN64839_c0_g1_i1.p3 TRINITY_DN64839_c0_g1~~TRINITY_DN64839_c0_g1_i1.p3  ORF type:complete len:109 (-),score=4.99 TRINITY_DN64839_c0_g1_i1:436-726(-)
MGVDEKLRAKGAKDGDMVRIMTYHFEFVDQKASSVSINGGNYRDITDTLRPIGWDAGACDSCHHFLSFDASCLAGWLLGCKHLFRPDRFFHHIVGD